MGQALAPIGISDHTLLASPGIALAVSNQPRLLHYLDAHLAVQHDPRGREHWLWTGPVRPGSGIPILYRWAGQKNVSVHRILWDALRPDLPLAERARLRRLDSCAWETCVAPGCFEPASTPLEPQTLPDYDAQPVDLMRSLTYKQERRRSKMAMLDGIQDRYIYRGDTYDVRCPCGCGEIIRIPICPRAHVLVGEWTKTWDSLMQMMGRQYRCGVCTRESNAARELRGSRPRPGFRPTSPAHNNFEQEMARFEAEMRSIPGSGETIGPGVLDEDEREMQAMEQAFREMPAEPDD